MSISGNMEVNKALYSRGDNRYNPHELHTLPLDPSAVQQLKQQAESVACLVNEGFFLRVNDQYQMFGMPSLNRDIQSNPDFKGVPLGNRERFKDEPCIGESTGFLVGKDLVVTAAHCVWETQSKALNENAIRSTLLVFGFQMSSATNCPTVFPKKNVYHIKNVIAHSYSEKETEWADWAVLKLDREVEGRPPLTLNFSDHIGLQTPLHMLGHPYGLPLKMTLNGTVKVSQHADKFECNLDAFGGNSGSPIFHSQTNKVVGILISGNDDFRIDTNYANNGISRVAAYHVQSHEGWETCQRISAMTFLKSIFTSINLPPANPLNLHYFSGGLSVEGKCQNTSCLTTPGFVLVSLGYGNFSSMSWQCAHILCPACNHTIPTDHVNTMVLSSCKYKIEGMDIQNTKMEGQFVLTSNKTNVFRFDLAKWKYLKLVIQTI